MSASIVILSQPSCYRCKGVARHLDNHGVEYDYIDVSEGGQWRDYMEERGLRNLPQVINLETGERIEGFDPDGVLALAGASVAA